MGHGCVPWDMQVAALFIQPYLVDCKVKILAWDSVEGEQTEAPRS